MGTFCPNINLPEWKELVQVVGENMAYYLWDLNNGNPLNKAPNGLPSKLFSDLLSNFNGDRNAALLAKAKVYSLDFKTWFGDWLSEDKTNVSKVVDENGEPLIVYHGTPSSFSDFNYNDDRLNSTGFFFTSDQNYAKNIAHGKGGNIVMPLFLYIKNPIDTNTELISKNIELIFIVEGNLNSDGIIGHDKYTQEVDKSTGFEYVVLKSNQVKSIHNSGLFSTTNNNIYYQKVSQVNKRRKLFTANQWSLSNRLSEQLQLLFPEISLKYVESLENGVVGQMDLDALEALIHFSESGLDTIPHEYAHYYIAMFRDSKLVKDGIKQFGSEEALVQAIGQRTVEMEGRVRNWWQKFLDFVKKALNVNKYSKQALLNELTDSFLSRRDLGEVSEVSGIRYLTTLKNISEVLTILKDMGDSVVFDPTLHTYLDKATNKVLDAVTKLKLRFNYDNYDPATEDDVQREVSEDARKQGTSIHSVMEALWTNNFERSNYSNISDEAIKDLKKIVDNLKKKYEFVAAEAVLTDPTHGVAGTTDLILKNKETGKYAIFDYKTKMLKYNDKQQNKKGKKLWGFSYISSTKFNLKTTRDGYDFQLSTYERILKDKGIEIESRGIIPIIYYATLEKDGPMKISRSFLSTVFGKDTDATESLEKEGFAKIIKKKLTEYDVDFVVFGDTSVVGGSAEFSKQMLDDLKNVIDTISKKLQIQKELARLKNRRTRAREAAKLYETMLNLTELDALFKYLQYAQKQIKGMAEAIKRILAKGAEGEWSLDYLREYNELASSYNQIDRIQTLAEKYVTIFGEEKVTEVRKMCSAVRNLQGTICGAYDDIGRQLYLEAIASNTSPDRMKYVEQLRYVEENPRKPEETQLQFNTRVKQHVDTWFELNQDEIEYKITEWLRAQSLVADNGFECSSLTANFQSVYESRDPFIQSMIVMFDRKMNENIQKLISFRSKMNNILKAYRRRYGLKNFSNLKETFNDLISYDNEGNAYLASDVDPQFQKDYQTMWDALKEDTEMSWELKYEKRQEWLDENCPISNLESYRLEYSNRVSGYIETLEEDLKKAIKGNINEDGTLKESWYDLYKKDKITYLMREKLGDIEDELDALYRKPILSKYANQKYGKLMSLSEDDPKRQLWELLDETMQIDATLPNALRLNRRLPAILKRGAEAIGSDGVITATKLGVQRLVSVMADDDFRGQFIDDDGKKLNQIPMYYFHNNRITPKEQSFDLPTIFFKWYEAALNYKAKQSLESYVIMTQHVLQTRRTKTNRMSLLSKELELVVEDYLTNTSKLFDAWVNNTFYGNSAKDYGSFTIPFTNKEIDKFKQIRAIVSLFSKTTMTFNWVSGINNFLVGESQLAEEAFASRYIDVKTYHKAAGIVKNNIKSIIADINKAVPTSFINKLAEWFVITELSPNLTLKGMWRRSVNDIGYFTSTAGDRVLRLRFMVAMLLKKRALDENGNDIGSMLQYLSFNENNELVVDDKVTNFDKDALNEFSLMLRRILMSIHGNYDGKRAAVAAEATWYGEIGLPLRRWIEPSAERRYNQEHYSELTKDVRKGFARSSLKYLFMNNKLFAPLISFIARNIFRVKDYQIQVMKWSDLSDLEKLNLRRMIMELAISTIAVLGFLLLASGGDDDDEPAIISNLRYLFYRLYTDLTFFYLPTSFSKILQSPFPAINYLNDVIGVFTQIPTFWQEYETGRHTFDNILLDRISDVIPGVKQIGRFENIGAEMEYFIRRN